MGKEFDCFYFEIEHARQDGKGCSKNRDCYRRCIKFFYEQAECKNYIALDKVIETLPD